MSDAAHGRGNGVRRGQSVRRVGGYRAAAGGAAGRRRATCIAASLLVLLRLRRCWRLGRRSWRLRLLYLLLRLLHLLLLVINRGRNRGRRAAHYRSWVLTRMNSGGGYGG